MKKQVWVTKRDNGWAVITSGSQKAVKVFRTQEEAKNYGQQLGKKHDTEFYLQDRHGKIRERDSYGNDPRSRKG